MIRQITDPRQLRGLAILSQPDTIIQTGKNEWDVRSQSKDAYYQIVRANLNIRIVWPTRPTADATEPKKEFM